MANILVLFERSGCVSIPFRQAGNTVTTIDIESHLIDNSHHIICDIFNIDSLCLDYSKFDMLIAFFPCTYFSKAGMHWYYKDTDRINKCNKFISLFKYLYDLPIYYKLFENPCGSLLNRVFRKCDFTIDYCEYADFKKKTSFWVEHLPPLLPSFINIKKYGNFITNMSYGFSRSVTPIEVGYAMVNQYNDIINE